MGNVLKRNRYRLVDNHSFELPLPMKFELYKEDSPVAEYEISADQKVSFRIITKYKEEMLTPINRPLSISDIYFFLSSRVFQDKTPFTRTALSSVGLEKYSVMDIVKKTRGMTPYDKYWVKFEGDSFSYEQALDNFKELFTVNAPVFTPASAPAPAPQPQQVKAPTASIADTEEILNQHKPDVSAIKEELGVPPMEAVPEVEEEPLRNNTMTADEIEALLAQSGLTDSPAIDHCDFDDDEPDSDTGKMSQDDIEKLIAAQMGAAEPAPEPKADNGGKMSQDDIEKLIAAQNAAAENHILHLKRRNQGGGQHDLWGQLSDLRFDTVNLHIPSAQQHDQRRQHERTDQAVAKQLFCCGICPTVFPTAQPLADNHAGRL